ncbi:hypothetical protein CRUP_011550, partial [Coryphaenoides rupestris]
SVFCRVQWACQGFLVMMAYLVILVLMGGGAYPVLTDVMGPEGKPVKLATEPDNRALREDLDARAHMVRRVRRESLSLSTMAGCISPACQDWTVNLVRVVPTVRWGSSVREVLTDTRAPQVFPDSPAPWETWVCLGLAGPPVTAL